MAECARLLIRWLAPAFVGALTVAILLTLLWVLTPPEDFDLIIRGGRVVDGTGREEFPANIYIRHGEIIEVGRRWRARGKREIKAAGLVVAPGFIDAHTHVERNVPSGDRPFLAENFVRQGVTTIVTGNCGTSVLNVAGLRELLERNGSQVNVATLVGHNSVRTEVMGRYEPRAPTSAEIARMQAYVDRALGAGALGLSTGLGYSPGIFATSGEIIAVAAPLKRLGGIYFTHLRNEGAEGEKALAEALAIAESLSVAAHICHLKAAGRSQWGHMAQRLRMIEQSRVQVTLDVYPYAASSTGLGPLLPSWFFDGTTRERRQSLEDRAQLSRLKSEMTRILRRAGWDSYDFVRVAYFQARPDYNGLSIPEIAALRATRPRQDHQSRSVPLSTQQDIVIYLALHGEAQMIYQEMSEDDVSLAILNPHGMIGSDSGVRDANTEAVPHPRGMGTFPRFLRAFALGDGPLSLPQAVYKMTSLPANTFGLSRRGVMKPGFWADITIFDPETISDEATYVEPLRPPRGIRYVLVNGNPVVWDGEPTRALSGRFLPKNDASAASIARSFGTGPSIPGGDHEDVFTMR